MLNLRDDFEKEQIEAIENKNFKCVTKLKQIQKMEMDLLSNIPGSPLLEAKCVLPVETNFDGMLLLYPYIVGHYYGTSVKMDFFRGDKDWRYRRNTTSKQKTKRTRIRMHKTKQSKMENKSKLPRR